jgi:hypothetical protein
MDLYFSEYIFVAQITCNFELLQGFQCSQIHFLYEEVL